MNGDNKYSVDDSVYIIACDILIKKKIKKIIINYNKYYYILDNEKQAYPEEHLYKTEKEALNNKLNIPLINLNFLHAKEII